MKKINFKDFPNKETIINAENLNEMQDNIEDAIPSRYIAATAGSNGDFHISLKDTTLAKGRRLLISFPTATNLNSNARLSIDNGNTYIDIKLLRGTNNIPSKVIENENLELIYNGSKWIVKSDLIAFVELTSAANTIEIPNLNLEEDGKVYEIIANGAIMASRALGLYYNNDKTASNYYNQRMRVNGNTTSAERNNNPSCGFFYSRNSQNTITLSLAEGYPTAYCSNVISNVFNSIESLNYFQHYTSKTNVTKLTIEPYANDSDLVSGTYVKVFKKSV